jgi:crotonobetainyl-CoA:carnitine CoA-transferase CaiB-like acyl-CoA transferase
MNDWCASRTTEETIQALEAARVPCGKVYEPAEVFDDPQVRARKLIKFMAYPDSPKDVPLHNPPVRLSETPGEIRHRAPRLGEHTEDVLREQGFRQSEIAGFREAGVI